MIDPYADIANEIKNQGEVALKPLYLEFKGPFSSFMRRYTSDQELILDAYQEAITAFYEYVIAGKFDSRKGSTKNLIYQMGRAYLINQLKKQERMLSHEDGKDSVDIREWMLSEHFGVSLDHEEGMKMAINELGKRCKELILLFFYHNCGVEVIMERMQYKNVNVVSSHKSRCLKQLKKLLDKKKQHGTF